MKLNIFKKALLKTELFFKKNGSTILTVVASCGVVSSVATAITATPKAIKQIHKDSEINHGDPDAYTKLEAFQSAWKYYIPTASLTLGTLSCIFGAHAVDKRRQASLISACVFANDQLSKYKAKVTELYGDDACNEVQKAIMKDGIEDADEPDDKELLFYDSHSDRYFTSTIKDVISAEYHLNRNFILRGYTDLNEFYRFLGIDETEFGSEVGWSCYVGETTYGYHWIDFTHKFVKFDDNLECYIIETPFEPTVDYMEEC